MNTYCKFRQFLETNKIVEPVSKKAVITEAQHEFPMPQMTRTKDANGNDRPGRMFKNSQTGEMAECVQIHMFPIGAFLDNKIPPSYKNANSLVKDIASVLGDNANEVEWFNRIFVPSMPTSKPTPPTKTTTKAPPVPAKPDTKAAPVKSESDKPHTIGSMLQEASTPATAGIQRSGKGNEYLKKVLENAKAGGVKEFSAMVVDLQVEGKNTHKYYGAIQTNRKQQWSKNTFASFTHWGHVDPHTQAQLQWKIARILTREEVEASELEPMKMAEKIRGAVKSSGRPPREKAILDSIINVAIGKTKDKVIPNAGFARGTVDQDVNEWVAPICMTLPESQRGVKIYGIEEIAKELCGSPYFKGYRVKFPTSGIEELYDSKILLGGGGTGKSPATSAVLISSKEDVSGGAAANIGGLKRHLHDIMTSKDPKDVDVVKSCKTFIDFLNCMFDPANTASNSPIRYAKTVGIISSSQAAYAEMLVDNALKKHATTRKQESNGSNAKIFASFLKMASESELSMIEKPAYVNIDPAWLVLHICARKSCEFINNPKRSGQIKKVIDRIFTKMRFVQVYMRSAAVGNNSKDLVMKYFKLFYPPILPDTPFTIEYQKAYYLNTKPGGRLAFRLMTTGEEYPIGKDSDLTKLKK